MQTGDHMRINGNSTAYRINNNLLNSENALQLSMTRLSSGNKLNNPGDDPAGYAISSVMRAQIEGLKKATNNANDGIAVIETAEGAVAEMQSMIQRMNELAVQASNGTVTSADRNAIQEEVQALCSEIKRIASETDFNSQPLLDGTFEEKGYTDSAKVKVYSYSEETRVGAYDFTFTKGADGKIAVTGSDLDKLTTNANVESDTNGNVSIKSSDGTEINFKIDPTQFVTGTNYNVNVDITGIGAMRLQIGANEGQVLELSIPELSLDKMGLTGIDCTNADNAKAAIDKLSDALDYSSEVRSKFGAYRNRLDHAIASLDVTSENMTASYSQLVDTDMAEEMTEYTTLQVLQQAGTTMLAQANEFPQQALQLLQ